MRYASRCTVAAALVASQLDADGHSSPLENCEEDNPPLAAASKWLTSAAFQSALLLASTGDVTADFVFSQGSDPWCLFSALHLLGMAADCQGTCALSIDTEFSQLSACQVETLEMLGVLDVCCALASNLQVPEVLCCFLDQRSRGRNCDNNSTARGGRSLLTRRLFIAASTFTLPTYDPCNQLVWDAEHHLDLVTIFVQWLLSCRWKQSLATVVESLFGLVDVSFLARAVGAPWMLIDDGTAAVLCGSEEERLVDAHELADMLRDGMRK